MILFTFANTHIKSRNFYEEKFCLTSFLVEAPMWKVYKMLELGFENKRSILKLVMTIKHWSNFR